MSEGVGVWWIVERCRVRGHPGYYKVISHGDFKLQVCVSIVVVSLSLCAVRTVPRKFA